MVKHKKENALKSVVSLEPLLDFWEKKLVPNCSHMASMFDELKQRINETPLIQEAIEDIDIFNQHQDMLIPLMSAVFPPASFDTEIAGAVTPYTDEPFFVTPKFQELFVDKKKFLKSEIKKEERILNERKLLRAYFLILDRIYDIHQGIETPMIRIVADGKTGLDRHFRITPDFQFINVKSVEAPKKLSQDDITDIIDNITNIDILKKYIDLGKFEFHGFSVVRAMDVTQSEIISILEKNLVDQHSIFSSDGISRVESLVRILFKNPGINVGIGARQGDNVMIIKSDCHSKINCIFANSHHISLKDLKGSIWEKAVNQDSIIRVADLKEKPHPCLIEEQAISAGVRSMLLAPLSYQGEIIGCFELFTHEPYELGATDSMLLKQIAPIFSVALKRGLDEMNKSVQGIIKEKCTAVHPSVEWKFEDAAISHMERLLQGVPSEMEPIIFKDVVPFFGQSDIRGSSLARNIGIQKDLTKQLNLALKVMVLGGKARSWPLLQEYKYRIEKRIQEITTDISSGDETSIFNFLSNEVEQTFDDLINVGNDVATAIKNYRKAIDPLSGVVYEKRKDYETSVSMLNDMLSRYIEQEDAKIQKTFPHYFEKRQTDGLDYMMYIGESMMKEGKLGSFHINNLTLWQLMIASGLALETEKIKPELKVPLDICHLILVNHKPLSIRFRYDEKRFDVDGAYDVRQEIIKSRLDKAIIKGTGERLTQPGKIAIVYTHPEEGHNIHQHIDHLTNNDKLNNDTEFLDLDDMPEVRGLKALRVGINLKAKTQSQSNIIEMKTG
ncbi:MAG: GAF domain-containing protein [Desulfobacterales bacterium]|nr:GAF domain-containing protein [Desulfobacterales bacterium]